MIGPVGFAETSSTWMRSGVSAEPAPKRLPASTTVASARPSQASSSVMLRNPGPATSIPAIPSRDAARSASSAATSRGGRLLRAREAQGDVRRVVAVLRVGRALERHGRAGELAERAFEAQDGVGRRPSLHRTAAPRASRETPVVSVYFARAAATGRVVVAVLAVMPSRASAVATSSRAL